MRGSEHENNILTEKRALLVKQNLIKLGVNATQIEVIGYGSNKILNQCKGGLLCIEEDHQVNNRIEIMVLSIAE